MTIEIKDIVTRKQYCMKYFYLPLTQRVIMDILINTKEFWQEYLYLLI